MGPLLPLLQPFKTSSPSTYFSRCRVNFKCANTPPHTRIHLVIWLSWFKSLPCTRIQSKLCHCGLWYDLNTDNSDHTPKHSTSFTPSTRAFSLVLPTTNSFYFKGLVSAVLAVCSTFSSGFLHGCLFSLGSSSVSLKRLSVTSIAEIITPMPNSLRHHLPFLSWHDDWTLSYTPTYVEKIPKVIPKERQNSF